MSGSPRTIPMVIVEEHHEAFYAWSYAQHQGWIPAQANTLLHADAHADMRLPWLRRRPSAQSSLTEVANFVYDELDIGSFIWPAAYMGTFNRILWLRHHHRKSAGGWREIVVSLKAPGAGEFRLCTPDDGNAAAPDPERKTVQYCPVTTAEKLMTDQKIVLDIDLDYFCCNEYPELPVRQLGITPETYREFQTNRYHFLRLLPGDKVTAREEDGSYYLTFNDYEPINRPDIAACRGAAKEKLDRLIAYLASNSISPALILICRSYWSGYTPGTFVDELQAQVTGELSQIYRIQPYTIAQILPAGKPRDGRGGARPCRPDEEGLPETRAVKNCPKRPS